MKTLETLRPVREGDPISAEEWNVIIADLQNKGITQERFIHNSWTIEITAHTNLEEWNIYTIDSTPPDDFFIGKCRAETKTYATGNKFLVSCDLAIAAGKRGYVYPLIVGVPYRLEYNYAGTASGSGEVGGSPSPGEEWGPVDGSTVLEEEGRGFIIVSKPDTVRRLVWAARVPPYVTEWYIGKTTEIIEAGTSGIVEQHSQGWSGTGVYFTVYNPHDVDLPSALKVRWTQYPEWDGWIVEPWHFTEC